MTLIERFLRWCGWTMMTEQEFNDIVARLEQERPAEYRAVTTGQQQYEDFRDK